MGSGAGQGEVDQIQEQKSPTYWIDNLVKNNPNLKADPMLVTSLNNQFRDSTDPQQLAHSTFMADLMKKSVDQIGLTNLYPGYMGEQMQPPRNVEQDKWWQATNTTSDWFGKLVRPIGVGLGDAMGFVTQNKQVKNFWTAVPSSVASGLAGFVSKAAVDVGRVLTHKYGDISDGKNLGQFSGQLLRNITSLPDVFMANLKSQINKNGWGEALGQQFGNFIGGSLLSDGLGGAADVSEGSTVLDTAAQTMKVADSQDLQLVKTLSEKMNSEGLTPEEQATLEKAKQDLTSRDPNALNKYTYQESINQFKTKFPSSYNILEDNLAKGAISQSEFDAAIAKGFSEETAFSFSKASEALNGETAVERAAQDAIQQSNIANGWKVWQNVARTLTYPVAVPLKGISMLVKTLGSRAANATYLLAEIQAQENPDDAYIWQLAQQGKVLNADLSTQDLGVEIANSLGIDGMWGTSIRDLVDVGLKWVVDDPLASFSRLAKEARSTYGMTGVLGKWFHGTGIFEVGDVERAYRQYSSVRRAIDWMASHSASQIGERFSSLNLSARMLNRLGEAKSSAEILNIFEEASQSIMLADRVTSMPAMGWYTYVKAGLRGATAEKFDTVADALASPRMPTSDVIDALEKETGIDITPHDVGYSAGGVAERARILFSQRLRRLFSSKQMIIEGGRITDRKLVVGSARSVNGIMQFLRNSYMSEDFTKYVGDQLIRYSDKPEKWNNIYNNSLRIALYRRMLASTAHSDFGLFIDRMGSDIDGHIYDQAGVDGGSQATGQAMVAVNNDLADRVLEDDGSLTVAAAGDKQLGERTLPTERQFRQLGRFYGKLVMEVNRAGGDVFLRSTDKTFEVVRQLADTADVRVEDFLNRFDYENRAKDFAPYDVDKASEKAPESEERIPELDDLAKALNGEYRDYHVIDKETGLRRYRPEDRPEIVPGDKEAQRKWEDYAMRKAWSHESRSAIELPKDTPSWKKNVLADIHEKYSPEENKWGNLEWPEVIKTALYKLKMMGTNHSWYEQAESNPELYKEVHYLVDHAPTENVPKLFRGISLPKDTNIEEMFYPGKVIDQKLSSFSGDQTFAKDWSIFNSWNLRDKAVVFELPEKSQALQVSGVNINHLDLQNEYLVPSGKYVVQSVSRDADGVVHVQLENEAEKQDSSFTGYMAKSRELVDRTKSMLESDELKGMSHAERYASVVKHLDDELDHARDLYTTASKKYERITMTRPGKDAVERAFGTGVDVPEMLKHMYGELTAIQDMGAEMKSAITSSFTSSENVEKQANYLSSTFDTAEAGEKYKELFKKKYDYAYTRQVGERIGLGKLTLANLYKKVSEGDFKIKSLGDRGIRSTFDPVVDMMQGYLNGWFKLLTLATPAWAERVVISEAMLNALRIGGHDFTESKLVQSIAKHELYLGKVAAGELERKALRSAISNIILGIDKALADTLKGKEFDDFLQFTTNLYMETDGHMLGGVHAQGDLMSEDGFQSAISNKIVGIENDRVKMSNKMLGDNFRRRNASDSDAGAALYESITRASRDTIFSEVARFELAKIETEGRRIFETNPDFYTKIARKDAYENLSKSGVKITNNAMNAEVKKSIEKQIRTLGGQSLSNSKELSELRNEANAHMEKFISEQPEEFRANFQRNTKRSAMYPDLTPHEGWARIAVDHIHGLSTNVNSREIESTIFPEILHQIANKDYQTQEELAKWMNDSYKKGDPVPSGFPAHEYIPLLSSGHFNPLRKFSDYLHHGPLGRIVNTGSREPIFVWEAWQQYKKWIPLVENGTIDMGEAMRKSQTDALINMSKFVHNPMDKTIWEENMRVVAPYYFAKNQAMRRALRVAGDNFAAFEKYLKINLAVTDYVALAYNQSGIGSFTFPGSQLVMGFTNGIVNSILSSQGLPTYGGEKSMGIESSPASPDSIIITGQSPGLGGFVENLINMPFGPIVTVPAKLVYEQMQYRVPFIANTIKWALGPASMGSSIWSDLFPNSTAQNVYKGVYGHFNQNQTGSYLSSEVSVLGVQAGEYWTALRAQAAETLEQKGMINSQNIRSGAAQELISYYAGRKFDQFMNNPTNRANFQDDANWHTTALYVAKTIVSTGTPLSAVISNDQQVQNQINKIAMEKNPDGSYKFPNYTLQVAELLRRFPNELFGTMAHTQSPFSTWNENYGTVSYVNSHEELVKAHPYITAFLGTQVGKGAQYDPVASQIFESLGLRIKETPSEFINNMRIAHGDYQFYNVMLPEYQRLYPGTYSDGLSSEGYYAWQTAGKYYAENTNSAWGNYHYGGQVKQTAVDTYQDLQSFMKDPSAVATLTPDQKKYIPMLMEARESWEKQYKAAAGEKAQQTFLESEWYNNSTNASTTPGWDSIASLITGVFQKLPPPQG